MVEQSTRRACRSRHVESFQIDAIKGNAQSPVIVEGKMAGKVSLVDIRIRDARRADHRGYEASGIARDYATVV
jgi:hypothetical protein